MINSLLISYYRSKDLNLVTFSDFLNTYYDFFLQFRATYSLLTFAVIYRSVSLQVFKSF
jgi:hypothetical protein